MSLAMWAKPSFWARSFCISSFLQGSNWTCWFSRSSATFNYC